MQTTTAPQTTAYARKSGRETRLTHILQTQRPITMKAVEGAIQTPRHTDIHLVAVTVSGHQNLKRRQINGPYIIVFGSCMSSVALNQCPFSLLQWSIYLFTVLDEKRITSQQAYHAVKTLLQIAYTASLSLLLILKGNTEILDKVCHDSRVHEINVFVIAFRVSAQLSLTEQQTSNDTKSKALSLPFRPDIYYLMSLSMSLCAMRAIGFP